jgi:hypothetical protein
MIFFDDKKVFEIKDQNIFLDNDFLGILFENEEFFPEFLEIFPQVLFLIDPLTAFEFMRDIFIPKQRELRERFIYNDKIFTIAPNHHENFEAIQKNALLLSKICSHKNIKSNPGIVDLFLAGRVMIYADNTILVTSNQKHFPRFLFDVVSVLNYVDEQSENTRTFYFLKFNKGKFSNCYILLDKVGKEDKK